MKAISKNAVLIGSTDSILETVTGGFFRTVPEFGNAQSFFIESV